MNTFHKISTAAILIASSLGIASAKDQSEEHLGEDGKVHRLNAPALTNDTDKISKKVREKAKNQARVDVIVFMQGDDISDKLSQVDDNYDARLKDLSSRLKTLDKKYRPNRSLPEKDERAFMRSEKSTMSAEDKTLTRSLKEDLDKLLDQKQKTKAKLVVNANAQRVKELSRAIKSIGGKINNVVPLGNTVGATVPSDLLDQLAAYPGVKAITFDQPVDYELNVSMPSASYSSWHNNDFDGFPYDFGIVDSGIQEDHPAFTGTGIGFCSPSGASVSSDHGTHVAGIAISNDTTYQGTAFGTDAVIWANAGAQSTTMSNMQWMITGTCQGPEVINHSLGYGVADDTDYSITDAFYDAFVQNYNVMVTKSSGNSGWSDTAPRITHPAPAYNLMAVANMNDQNTTSRSDDVRRGTSSVGPTLNNRRKPDISAPGTSILSTNSDWASEADFIGKTGTSMAAPHVAGAIILMEDGGNHTPMAQKAILLNTADAWDSNNTSTTADDESVSGSHWDKSYGWGYIDMWESHYNRGDYFVDSVIPRNNNNIENDYKLFAGRMFTNEKATLVWQRRSDFASGPTGDAFNLSDLNIRLYAEGNSTTRDSDLVGNDNVHQVAADATIDSVVKVYAWSTSFDGASSESFALATEENFSAVNPPSLNIPPQSASGSVNQNVSISLTIDNNGGVGSCNVQVTRGSVSGITGTTTASTGNIPAGDSGTVSFTLSGNSTGSYSIPFTATTTCYDETYTDTGILTFTLS